MNKFRYVPTTIAAHQMNFYGKPKKNNLNIFKNVLGIKIGEFLKCKGFNYNSLYVKKDPCYCKNQLEYHINDYMGKLSKQGYLGNQKDMLKINYSDTKLKKWYLLCIHNFNNCTNCVDYDNKDNKDK